MEESCTSYYFTYSKATPEQPLVDDPDCMAQIPVDAVWSVYETSTWKGTIMELDYKRIVVTFLMHLGDVILTTPFLEVLRKAAPHSHITYM